MNFLLFQICYFVFIPKIYYSYVQDQKYFLPLNQQSFYNFVTSEHSSKWIIVYNFYQNKQCNVYTRYIENALQEIRQQNFQLGYVDCEEDENLCKFLDVKQCPWLVVVNKDRTFKFSEQFTQQKIKQFLAYDWINSKGKRLYFDAIFFFKFLCLFGCGFVLFLIICGCDFCSNRKQKKGKFEQGHRLRDSHGRFRSHRGY